MSDTKKPSPRWAFWAVVAVVAAVNLVLFIRNPGDINRFLINALLALSAFVTLHARLLSLANAGFMAIGAYASAILVVKAGLPFALALPLVLVICALVALVIGLPVLRLNDVYLAICTLGFGEVVRILIILNVDLTGGPTGANLSTGFPYEAMLQTQEWMLVAAIGVMVYLYARMSGSRAGRAFRAIRENPSAAATMGINTVGYRNLAFVMSAVIAGLAGAFYAHSVGSLDAGDFKFSRAVDILSYAVLGGSGHWLGPLLGAGVLTALPVLIRDVLGVSVSFLHDFVQLPNIVNGLALMLTIVFLPGGLVALGLSGRRHHVRPAETKAAVVTAGTDAGEVLLQVENVSRLFGGITALANIDFTLLRGQIYGLIGPNGAGKTTTINVVTGLFKPTTGRILWKGRDTGRLPAYRIARSGIARTYQNIQLFADMSVLENVIVGAHAHIRTNLVTTWLCLPSEARQERDAVARAWALLESLGLADLANTPAGKLSYGDQRRVEIARALAMEPELLLLDEPAAGMNEAETERLADFIAGLKTKGYTILVIEHHMDLIMKICDELIVFNFGKQIAQGTPAEISRNEAVVEAYLGRE